MTLFLWILLPNLQASGGLEWIWIPNRIRLMLSMISPSGEEAPIPFYLLWWQSQFELYFVLVNTKSTLTMISKFYSVWIEMQCTHYEDAKYNTMNLIGLYQIHKSKRSTEEFKLILLYIYPALEFELHFIYRRY